MSIIQESAAEILYSQSQSQQYHEEESLTPSTLLSQSVEQSRIKKDEVKKASKIRRLRNKISIEPVFFLFAMGDCIVSMVVQTYYIDRVCRIKEGYTAQVCNNLTAYAEQEKTVEQVVAEFSMFQMLIEGGFPLILSLFLGPLTDKMGYKCLLLYSMSGYILRSLFFVGSYFLPWLPPGYLLIASVPVGLSGGGAVFLISCYGYAATQTNEKNRSYRMGALSAMWDIGTVMGFLCGSMVFNYGGFLPIFLYTTTFYTIAFLYTFTMVTDDKPDALDLSGTSQSFSDALSLRSVQDIFFASFRRRAGHRRKIIFIITASAVLIYLAFCSWTSMYLFTREKFGWGAEQFSMFSATSTLLSGTGSVLITLLLMKMLRIRDVNILMINGLSQLTGYCIFASAQCSWHMYLGSVMSMFGSTISPTLKSLLSKCVDADEFGKLLTFLVISELTVPFFSGPLYTSVYINTISSFPGAVFVVAALSIGLVLVLFTTLRILMRHGLEYTSLVVEVV